MLLTAIPEPKSHRCTERLDFSCQMTACCPNSKVAPQNPGIVQAGKICRYPPMKVKPKIMGRDTHKINRTSKSFL